jgi:hypothetical protein
VALGIVPWLSSWSSVVDESCALAFEVQLHGDIRFRDHVEAVVVDANLANNEGVQQSLAQFASRYDVPIVWQTGGDADSSLDAAKAAPRTSTLAALICSAVRFVSSLLFPT